MRTNVSSSLFGFVTLAAFALAGCSFSTEAESPAESATEAGNSGSSTVQAIETASPELGPVGFGTNPSTASGVAKVELGSPPAGSSGKLVAVELSTPELRLRQAGPNGPAARATAAPELGPVSADPTPIGTGCSSAADCGTPGCYNGMQESFFCDSAGACQVQIDSCETYACGDSACHTDCRTDAECAEDARCAGGRCLSK